MNLNTLYGLLFSVIFVISMYSIPAEARQALPQIIVDDETFINNVHQHKTDGVVSGAQILLNAQLEQPLKLEFYPLNRLHRKLETADNAVCSPYRVKNNERVSKYLFSVPAHLLLMHKLYQNDNLPVIQSSSLDIDGKLSSLDKLTSQYPNEKIIMVSNHSYGDTIDKQLLQIDDSYKLIRNTSDFHSSTSSLFFARRASFALMFPGEVFEYAQKHPNISFKSYSIANAKQSMYSHYMCNKHKDSQAFISQLNKAILAMQSQPDFLDLHLQYNWQEDAHTVRQEIAKLRRFNGLNINDQPVLPKKLDLKLGD